MRTSRRRKSGFTLLELMLVMAILVVLASLATMAVLGMQRNANSRAAMAEMQTLKTACTAYKLNVGAFPVQLDDLHTMPAGMNRTQWGGPYIENRIKGDPWNRQYIYQPDDANDRVIISSHGPDGLQGTEDDIIIGQN